MQEYEIIVFPSKNGPVECYLVDGDIYLSQKSMAKLFSKTTARIGQVVNNCIKSGLPLKKTLIVNGKNKTTIFDQKTVLELAKILGDFSIIDFQNWAENELNPTEIVDENEFKFVRFNQDNLELDIRVSPKEQTIWMTQEEMAELFETTQQNISLHLNNIYDDKEADFGATHKFFLYVQTEGERQVNRKIIGYNLDAILAVGYRINTKKGIVFRRWATSILTPYLRNGYVVSENRVLAFEENINSLNQCVINLNVKTENHEKRIKDIEDNDTIKTLRARVL